MRPRLCLLLRSVPWLLAATASSSSARAEDPPSGFLPRFELDTGRAQILPPEVDQLRLAFHGEYQLRSQVQSTPPLRAPTSDPGTDSAIPTGKILQWFRVTPRLQIATHAEIVAQFDLLRGLATSSSTRYLDAAAVPESPNLIAIDPRWLYLDWLTKAWKIRIGQQPIHLGAGMLFNDGDHPTLFGDYQRGDSAERVQATLRPGGRTGLLVLWAAGDLVYRDEQAQLLDGDLAWRAMGGMMLGTDTNQIGATGVVRYQQRRAQNPADLAHLERQKLNTLDVHGRFATKAPAAGAYLFGEGEAAIQQGYRREHSSPESRVEAWGAILRLGVAHETTRSKERFADVVVTMAWGYASGDDNPSDGKDQRFAMNPNHNVGLILFDLLIHMQTARAATLLRSATLPLTPPAGQTLSPTNGSVAGATYVNPTVVVRPSPRLDLKAGFLVAQTTADPVDAYALATGRRENHRGGPPNRRDLGLELDAGIEWRTPVTTVVTLQLGAQAGVLFPGAAFEDATGNAAPSQYLAAARVGFQY